MKLTSAQADRFYAAWWPLLSFVNEKRGVLPGRRAGADAPFTVAEALAIRDALWADDSLLATFVAENPAALDAELLATVASWRHRLAGTFIVWKHLKKHSLLLLGGEVLAVLGLRNGLEEILHMPPPPTMVRAVLLPFEGAIVADGLLTGHMVSFGPGARRSFKVAYDDAVERGAVRTSLVPTAPAPAGGGPKAIRAANRKVLSALRSYLQVERRLAAATVVRDLGIVTHFADVMPVDRSLRDCTLADVQRGVAVGALVFGGRAHVVAALKRFVEFMLQTERVERGRGVEALAWLKAQGAKP